MDLRKLRDAPEEEDIPDVCPDCERPWDECDCDDEFEDDEED